MKFLLRPFLANSVSLWLAGSFLGSISYSGSARVLFLAAGALTLVNLFVRPIVKLLTLPINFLTLGLFSILTDIFMIYLATRLVPGFSLQSFILPSLPFIVLEPSSFKIPLFWSFVITSLFINFFSGFVFWVFRR